MKRLVAALIVFILSVTVGITGHAVLMKRCDGMIESIESCITLAEQGEKIEELRKQSALTSEKWKKNHEIFSVLVIHSKLDIMEMHLSTLDRNIDKDNLYDYIENCLESINMLEDMKKNEKISLGNIF